MDLSPIHFSQIYARSRYNLPLTPESPAPCPYTDLEAASFAWPLTDDQVPRRILADRKIDARHLGDVHRMELHLLVSGRVAEVLSRFDLGRTRLTPVPLVNTDGTEIPGDWHHLHVCERKDTVVPLEADRFDPINDEKGLVSCLTYPEPGAIAVEPGAETGVDLWRDPMWRTGLYASAELVAALRAAGVGAAFEWAPARRATDADRADAVMERQNAATAPPVELMAAAGGATSPSRSWHGWATRAVAWLRGGGADRA